MEPDGIYHDSTHFLATPSGGVALVVAVALVVWGLYVLAFGTGIEPEPFLEADQWKLLPLIDRVELNHNTRRFRFGLPNSKQRAGLPIGKHILFRATCEDEQVIKPYTPVSDDQEQRGYIDFVIKVYPEGRMSQHLKQLKIGDKLEFKGPKGRFVYSANMKRAIGMLAGGTGITPMYQTARAILKDPKDHTMLSLIYGNLTDKDILIKDLLDELVQSHPDRFQVYYVVNDARPGWEGGSGFVTPEMITQHLPAPATDILVVKCGPPAMNKAMSAHLDTLGYARDVQFDF
ncbi:hypothetical protein WJX73_001360 [Symbiochloris irregularis]|uniref:cytochrome-b5 reductase n=1 Tax=Symbiochloris irregularis TaxID=706552 RepID=A0AAW1P270_9CHLO